jgi:hypothetical protein
LSKVELRAKIDANKNEADYVKAAKMLEEAEADLLTKWVFPASKYTQFSTLCL